MYVATINTEDGYDVVGYCDYCTENAEILFKALPQHYAGNIYDKKPGFNKFKVVDLGDGRNRAILVNSITDAKSKIPSFKTLCH